MRSICVTLAASVIYNRQISEVRTRHKAMCTACEALTAADCLHVLRTRGRCQAS